MTPDDASSRSHSDFAGHRAVVTGAGGGIGRAVAEHLLSRGATVVACDVSGDALGPLAERGIETVVADLSCDQGRGELAAAAGLCHHLVIAHGIVRPKPITETTVDDWDAIIGVNAKAVYFLCQTFGELLQDGGSIVTVSSVSARSAASLEQSVYCASKAAVGSITRSFAYAYAARRIRVNSILPGIIDTPMQEKFLERVAQARGTTAEALHEARLASVPLRRTASPAECSESILWLLSPASSYITGQQIAVDGGMTMY